MFIHLVECVNFSSIPLSRTRHRGREVERRGLATVRPPGWGYASAID